MYVPLPAHSSGCPDALFPGRAQEPFSPLSVKTEAEAGVCSQSGPSLGLPRSTFLFPARREPCRCPASWAGAASSDRPSFAIPLSLGSDATSSLPDRPLRACLGEGEWMPPSPRLGSPGPGTRGPEGPCLSLDSCLEVLLGAQCPALWKGDYRGPTWRADWGIEWEWARATGQGPCSNSSAPRPGGACEAPRSCELGE